MHSRHQWQMRFDSVCCRNCGVTGDDGKVCKGAKRVRPLAAMRLAYIVDRPKGHVRKDRTGR